MPGDNVLLDIAFDATVIHWRGPAPWFFVAVPAEHVDETSYAARQVSYGWGAVPVEAWIGDVGFTTSLFPRNGGYLLPLRAAVRKPAGIGQGDRVRVRMLITTT